MWSVILAATSWTGSPQQPESPNYALIAILVSILLALLSYLVIALIAAGKTSNRLSNIENALSDLPRKGDVRAEIAFMKSELLVYVNEHSQQSKRSDEVLEAVRELTSKVKMIEERIRQ